MFALILALLAAVNAALSLYSPTTGPNSPLFVEEIPSGWAHQMPVTPPEPVSLPIPTSGSAVQAATDISACPAVIREVFGPTAGAACRVSHCETGGKYNADAVGNGSFGLFQIIPTYHQAKLERLFAAGKVDNLDYFDPRTNTVLAADISSGGTDWSQWSCQPSGELKTWTVTTEQ